MLGPWGLAHVHLEAGFREELGNNPGLHWATAVNVLRAWRKVGNSGGVESLRGPPGGGWPGRRGRTWIFQRWPGQRWPSGERNVQCDGSPGAEAGHWALGALSQGAGEPQRC